MADAVAVAIYKMGLDSGQYVAAAGAVDSANTKMVASTASVSVAEERVTKATRTTVSELERRLGRLDPLIRAEQEYQAALSRHIRFEEEGIGTTQRRLALLDLEQQKYDAVVAASGRATVMGQNFTSAARLNAFQVQNLGSQLNDISVMLASGQSPFVMLMQQGMQITQIFNQGTGLSAALKAVGAGVISFVTNPLNLAVAGFAAAAGAASLLWKAVGTGVSSADEALRLHKDLIDRIRDAYGDAGAAATRYAKESAASLKFDAVSQLESEQARLRDALSGFANTLTSGHQQSLIGLFGHDADAARASISSFIAAIRAGGGDVLDFRAQMSEIGNGTQDERLREMVQRIREMTGELATLATQAGQTAGAMKLFAGSAAKGNFGGSGSVADDLFRNWGEMDAKDQLRGQMQGFVPQKSASSTQDIVDLRPQITGMAEDVDRLNVGLGRSLNIFSGFSASIREGGNAWDELANRALGAIDSITDRLLDQALNALLSSVGGLFGGSGFNAFAGGANGVGSIANGYAWGGVNANGGLLSGPGTGTSDSIVMRASAGEFVVNADATSRNLGLLEEINRSRGFADGGMVERDPSVLVGLPSGYGEILS